MSEEAPHYDVDPKTGERTWSGSSRSEVAHWRGQVELLRGALLRIELASPEHAKWIAAEAIRSGS